LQWRVKVVTELICLFESVSQTERMRETKGEIGGGERERERDILPYKILILTTNRFT